MLRPILHDDPTHGEKRLLDSTRMDVPPSSSKARTLAALGVAAAATTAAGTGTAATGATVLLTAAKVLAVVAVGGVVAFGAVRGASRSRPEAPGPASTASGASVEKVTDRVSPTGGLQLPAVERASAPVASDVPPSAPGPIARDPVAVKATSPAKRPTPGIPVAPSGPDEPTPAPATAGSPTTLAAEIAALEAVRGALASGDPSASLRSLDDYDRRFASPALGPEAAVLRVQSLLALGRVDEAHKLGERLLAEQPGTAYSQRIRSLLGDARTPAR
jgi:hypothetical protein